MLKPVCYPLLSQYGAKLLSGAAEDVADTPTAAEDVADATMVVEDITDTPVAVEDVADAPMVVEAIADTPEVPRQALLPHLLQTLLRR